MKVEDVPLPGFRLHPIYEELVGFYLRRRVENKPVKIQLIKRMDIYRYDRWDLPMHWVKENVSFYRGSAGKGTKTDWMMHEFRLPREDNHTDTIQKARKVSSHRKYREDWREIAAKHKSIAKTRRCPTISLESKNGHENYIKFGAPIIHQHYDEEKQQGVNQINGIRQLYRNVAAPEQLNRIAQHPLFASSSSFSNQESYFFIDANWDELRSVVEFADIDPFLL
ncbi:hypothetical protein PVK06_017710 [Gossypium arboreum]|uniref:NAC domain-containing protein n=1 Tax=Gossypium arboreum TaxID=29729 RepID=A0ABR0Q3U9_GOSAR|nr:hypothetical protein PVK06_017710 [Gossypium arboreum]